ncbi:MAG: HIRAN domain-containing protein [Oscillospiraceae bacterium]|nr:HIRAN domain-containing protein [Oscillospiraceae bacterium]
MSSMRSKVMITANRLVKRGFSRSLAMVKAWILAKADKLRVKITGTSRRQNSLNTLTKYMSADISAIFRREPHNRYDSNAIAVYAAAPDRRMFFIGYLSASAAYVIAPLMDRGIIPTVKDLCIVGGYNAYVNLGARVLLSL